MSKAADSLTADDCRAYQMAVRNDPEKWMRDALGVELWGDQKKVTRALFKCGDVEKVPTKSPENSIVKVTWRTGHAVGKSHLASAVAITRLHAFSPGYVITTGASWEGIKKILWPTIRNMWRNAKVDLSPGIEPMTTEWMLGDGWGAFGVSTNEVENLAGFHEVNGPLVIIDEASALTYELYESILGLCSTANSAIFAIGNPIYTSGPFRDMFDDPEFECFHTSSEDTPNVKEGKTVIPGLCEKSYINTMKKTYGEKSAAYQSRVKGDFPASEEDSLITLGDTDAAMDRYSSVPGEMDEKSLKMGIDVARFGGDRTVFFIRDDFSVLHLESFHGQDTMVTCGMAKNLIDEWNIDPECVFVDDSGVGGGVTDRLREMDYGVTPVNNSERALDSERFANVRSECYWLTREAIRDQDFALPPEMKELAKELRVPKYKIRSDGRIIIESKDDIKKYLKRSPDLSDAMALTFYPAGALVELF